jgi:hypothetical protein
MAPLAYCGLMFLVPMAPWIAAEYFAPPYGLLATMCPSLQKDQARWFGLRVDERASPDESDLTGLAKGNPAPTDEATIVYLSDLKPRIATIYPRQPDWPQIGIHSLYAVPEASVADKPCYSLLVFDLPKSCQGFTGTAAIGDIPDKKRHGKKVSVATADHPLTFQIIGDARVLWTSRPLQYKNDKQSFQVYIADVKELQLRVDCPGSHHDAFAIWDTPALKKKDAKH